MIVQRVMMICHGKVIPKQRRDPQREFRLHYQDLAIHCSRRRMLAQVIINYQVHLSVRRETRFQDGKDAKESLLLTWSHSCAFFFTEPTLMTRLVDRLQEMTAPPPPMAMRTAYRQQEQRRQKLFVGEYSMREGNSHGGGSKDGGQITIMGTNPFRRSSRAQGSVAGGWGEKKVNDMSRSGARSPGPDLTTTSRTFPLARTSSRTLSFRNGTSEAIYGLAPHIQTSVVRSSLQAHLFQESVVGEQATAGYGDLLGGTLPSVSTKESRVAEIGQDLLFWGAAKDICDVVSETLRQDKKSNPLVDPYEETIALTPSQGSSTLTGLVRDMIDWIEQEDWERRLVKCSFFFFFLFSVPR